MTASISKEDVARLLAEPSPQRRAEIGAKLAREIDNPALTAGESALAQEIVDLMARDIDTAVRQSLAHSLRHTKAISHETALRLANDIDAVALPILSYSPALSEQDLLDVARHGPSAKQQAIAIRPYLSENLSDALVDYADELAVTALMGNATAHIGDASLAKAVDRFADSDIVKQSMVKRDRLPANVTERLVALVSDHLQDYLVSHHAVSPALIADIVVQNRERSLLNLTGGSSQQDIEKMAAQMHSHGRLTPSVVMRAICMGDISFFEAAMAVLADVPLVNASILLHSKDPVGLRALYDKSGLSPTLFVAVKVALEVIHETPLTGAEHDRERYRALVLERILTQHEGLNAEDLDYLVEKLEDISPLARPDAHF